MKLFNVCMEYCGVFLCNKTLNWTFFENTQNYNKNYQTDISCVVNIVNGTYDAYKNQYTAIEDDFISAFGTYLIWLYRLKQLM